ncbi:MAG: glycerol dehydrogenase related enzyme [Haloquadratum sp. J07HQX50]|nr:MAG: glycerol dehydrogenase related enzyme [Haloquadratum sp. J07HQX50]
MFEKTTWINLPRTVLVGHRVIDDLAAAVGGLYLSGPPLIVTSPTPNSLVGDTVREQFDNPVTTIVEKASFEAVEGVVDTASAADVGYLLAVGGGKPIDIAKMASEQLGCGFVSVPTAASHDGIVSGRSSIPEGDTRHSVAANPPLAVVADTAILAGAPWELTTAGCADIISNYTAIKDWQLANRLRDVGYSEYAGALSQMTAEMLVSSADVIKPGFEESAWVVAKALVSSGVAMSIAGSSRPASGAEHLISHQLDRLMPGAALHGHQVGVAAILTEYLHSGDTGEYTDIATALDEVGAPTKAADLGIEEETFIEAVTTAHTIRDRHTILGNGISRTAARQAATVTEII